MGIFFTVFIIGLCLLPVLLKHRANLSNKIAEPPTSSIPSEPIIPIPFNPTFFFNALRQSPLGSATSSVCVGARAIIVPHHDVASGLIADIFSNIAQNFQPKTIIIIGPNHPNVGIAPVYSADIGWKTPDGGVVHLNSLILKQLTDSQLVRIDRDIISEEHSVYVPVAFIHHYFPKAQVVPIIIKSTQKTSASFTLAQVLAGVSDKNTLIIGSIDFSHYLPSSATVSKDAITEKLFIEKNYEKIASLNNDYIDSPQTLITVLKNAELLGASNVHVVNHSELGKIAGHPVESSTSYFTLCIK